MILARIFFFLNDKTQQYSEEPGKNEFPHLNKAQRLMKSYKSVT